MSRLYKYKDCIVKFLKDRCCIQESRNKEIITKQILNIDPLLAIVLLTIMNSQQKKHNLTSQGYYAASSILILQLYCNTNIDDKSCIINYATKSLWQNLNLFQNNIQDVTKRSNIIQNVMNYYFNNINGITNMPNEQIEFDGKPNVDVKKWYIKEDRMLEHFNSLQKIKIESYNKLIMGQMIKVVEMAVFIGFMLGGGDVKDTTKLTKLVTYYAYFYKLYIDFINLEDDLNKTTKYSTNYVINYGILNSYESFMSNKQKFIEECMLKDMYTSTIKEIVNYISSSVDQIIDETSPDLRSNASSMT